MAVPRYLTASALELYGDDSRRYVWASRREDQLVPDDMVHLEEFQWLIGGICHTANEVVSRMASPAELVVWKLAHNQATSQFFAGNNAIIRLLNQQCVGKVWRTAVHVDRKTG